MGFRVLSNASDVIMMADLRAAGLLGNWGLELTITAKVEIIKIKKLFFIIIAFHFSQQK